MENNIKHHGFLHHLKYIKTVFRIKFIELIEYKTNFYSGLIMNIIFTSVFAMFYFIYYNNFNDFLGWGLAEYVFFTFVLGINAIFFGMFWFGANLSGCLLGGKMNVFLTKPINVYLQYLLDTTYISLAIGIIIYIPAIIFTIFYFGITISILDYLFLTIYSIICGIFFVAIHRTFDSLSFFGKRVGRTVQEVYRTGYTMFDIYPAPMFKGWIRTYSLWCANAYYGAFITQYIFGHIGFNIMFKYFTYLVGLSILFISLIIISWHFGLKKYEAFG